MCIMINDKLDNGVSVLCWVPYSGTEYVGSGLFNIPKRFFFYLMKDFRNLVRIMLVVVLLDTN